MGSETEIVLNSFLEKKLIFVNYKYDYKGPTFFYWEEGIYVWSVIVNFFYPLCKLQKVLHPFAQQKMLAPPWQAIWVDLDVPV